MDKNGLAKLAAESAKAAYSPYSEFKVGAALLCTDGTVYTGCNIENSAYSATVCAERVAFFKAVSEGKTEFEAIAVAGGKDAVIDGICPPCGVCRQVMAEFCDSKRFKVLLVKKDGFEEYSLEEILPLSFGKDCVK
ncbi:MAG: cytidine deaminase [Clostridia bacterium]|nr:cytidine deaminase [Clostridia bacterium]